jgi:hypothetical protein
MSLPSFVYAETLIKVKATDEQRRKYDFIYTLTKKEANRLDVQFEEILNQYRLRTRKDIAVKRGYAEEVYGEDNFKYIELGDFYYMIYEDRFNRILYKNVNSTSIDDF